MPRVLMFVIPGTIVIGTIAYGSEPAAAQATATWMDAQKCQQISEEKPEESFVYCNSALNQKSELSVDETSKTLIARGNAFLRANKDFDKAIADFSAAVLINEYNARAFMIRSFAYADHGDIDMALEDIQRVLTLEPKNTTAYLVRGKLFAQKGELAKAVADADTAGKLTPNFYLVHFQRGIIFTLVKENDLAKKAYLRALELSPPRDYAENIQRRIKTLNGGTQ